MFRILINSIIFSKNECFNINLFNKYQIMIDHLIFLFFPFIIEYLSLIYYIFFFPNKFIIQSNNKLIIILFLIMNVILIVEYNIENYIDMICINRTYKNTFFEVYLNIKNKKLKRKSISYKCSNIIIYIFIFLQNFPLFVNIENYLIEKKDFKTIISVILLICILLYFSIHLREFNYSNFINSLINSILLFCLYAIILDIIMYLVKYKNIKRNNEIIYFLAIISLSYITNILLIKIKNVFFISKILEFLFQEDNNINEKYLINSLYYLHEIMLSIKYENNNESSYLLIKFIKNHFYKCIKTDCKCKLFKECNFNTENQIENYIPKLIIILNYLFELIFQNYNIYQSYELLILLSEHFYHLKNNPIIAMSFILNFLLKKEKQLNIFELIVMDELCKKYIYYISTKILIDLDSEEKGVFNKTELSLIQKRTEQLNNYSIYLKKSNKIKKLICIYIDIFIHILKYKNIFNDSLSFHYYENSENINYR